VRIIGTITLEPVEILQRADAIAIVIEEICSAGLYREIWQSSAVRTVGVMGDDRRYAYPIIIRPAFPTRCSSASPPG
jgi:GMP synthase (glutamine-hydrolysing)